MPRYRLQLVPCAEVARDDPRDLGAVPLAHPAEGLQQRYYGVLTRQTVKDPFALASSLNERRAAKKLQVPGCVRHGQTGSGSEVFDAPLALAEMFEQFEAMGVPERLCDLGETDEDALFRTEA